MTEENPTAASEGIESITPELLKERIDEGDEGNVFLLDVRSKGDFEEWHIEDERIEIVNRPYFELLDGIPTELLAELPDDRTITVLCAKGGSSEMIAEQLQQEGYDANHLERGMKGWAGIYEYAELDTELDATIAQYRRPSSGCLAYLIVSDGQAVVIDPLRAFTREYVHDSHALGAELTYALDTHVHADHVSGVRSLARETDATAVMPKLAAERGIDYEIPYETISDGDTLAVGDVEIEAIHTPGHTTGMTAYRVGDVLFTGDGLFTESVARPDLEDPDEATSAARTLYGSLTETVLPMLDGTIVAPAHFSDAATPRDDGTYTATLGDLTERMDALSMDEEAFAEFVVSEMPPQPANHGEIIATNLGQYSPDDEEAFSLELGPNNCAASEEALTN